MAKENELQFIRDLLKRHVRDTAELERADVYLRGELSKLKKLKEAELSPVVEKKFVSKASKKNISKK